MEEFSFINIAFIAFVPMLYFVKGKFVKGCSTELQTINNRV